jgi:ATP-dependent helicase/nuclease subunit A
LRISSAQTAEAKERKLEPASLSAPAALPPWGKSRAPRESQLAVPLAPSRLAPYETDETGEPLATAPPRDPLAEPPALPPAAAAGDNRFLRGTLTHALLQYLPGFDRRVWPKAARAFVDKRGAGLPSAHRASIAAETLRILEDTSFAPLFGPESRAEVSIAAVLPRPKGPGPALKIGGQIDRLAVLDRVVIIVYYKTNRRAPATLEGVADVYLYQLAAYRLAVAEIYKDKPVRAALLWTDSAKIMEIPGALLDAYASRLWDLDQSRLDA